jgi:hypothetical protein
MQQSCDVTRILATPSSDIAKIALHHEQRIIRAERVRRVGTQEHLLDSCMWDIVSGAELSAYIATYSVSSKTTPRRT